MRKHNPMEIVQEIEVWPWYQHKPESIPENETHGSSGLRF